MRARFCAALVAVAASFFVAVSSHAAAQRQIARSAAESVVRASTSRPVYRVLFVGNSYTRFHSMPLMVRAALRVLPSRPEARVEILTRPGWTLERHVRNRRPLRRIARGRFTHVVLQGHSLSALEAPEAMLEAARTLAAAGRLAGARTLLYETWARGERSRVYRRERLARDPEDMTARIGRAYAEIGHELSAPVAPVGRAFAIVRAERPDLRVIGVDASHPTRLGSYLAACTLAAVIADVDPRTIDYVPYGLDARVAAVLRDVAARAIAVGP